MEKTKSNKLVCDLCWFVVPGRAQSSPQGPEVSEPPPLTSLTASNCYWAGGLEGWLEILFNVFEQRKARYSTAAQGQKPQPRLYKVTDAVHSVCVCVFDPYMGHWAKLEKLNIDQQLFPLDSLFKGALSPMSLLNRVHLLSSQVKWTYYYNFGFYENYFSRFVVSKLIKVLQRVSETDMLTTSGEKNRVVIQYICWGDLWKMLLLAPCNLCYKNQKEFLNREDITSRSRCFWFYLFFFL